MLSYLFVALSLFKLFAFMSAESIEKIAIEKTIYQPLSIETIDKYFLKFKEVF
jgi:hypothetical protein